MDFKTFVFFKEFWKSASVLEEFFQVSEVWFPFDFNDEQLFGIEQHNIVFPLKRGTVHLCVDILYSESSICKEERQGLI